MKVVTLPESWRGRAMVIRDVDEPERWFTEEELAIANAFPREKRRQEWMLSRIAAKELSATCDPRPAIFTFSHSWPYAAAATGGIDVQVIRDVDERTAHLFLTDEETDQMRRCTIPHRLLHFWCAKEAEWKRLRGGIPTLKRVPLWLHGQEEHGLVFDVVETYATADAIVALTRPTS